jgi:hypothetical protein
MTIKQQGGIFGRNPEFNEVDANTGSFTDLTATNLTTTKDGAVSATFNRLTSKGDMLLFEYNGSRIGSLGLEASGLYLDGEDSHMGIKFVSSQLFPRDDGVDTNGSNDLGGTSNRWRNLYLDNSVIVSSGGGIDFSATSGTGTSELFDDYEEGTFTPVVADAASGGNEATASASNGYYTKIGRSVTVTIDLQNINTSGLTSGNDIFITGLPFSAGSLTGNINYTGLVNGGGTLSSAKSVIAVVFDNVSYIRLVEATSTSVSGWLDVSEINSGATDFRFSVTYFA